MLFGVKSYHARDGRSHIKIHNEDVLPIIKGEIRQSRNEIEFKHEHRIHEPNIPYDVGILR